MRLFREAGELAAAERVIQEAARDPRNERTAVMVILVPIYSELGRVDEAAQLLEEHWEQLNERGEGGLEPAIKLARSHFELTWKGPPVENLQAVLDSAARLAPDDDRVWLGRANLAIRTKAYDEAARWLDACHKRRPDDVPVWCARLRWGIATNRVDVVRAAAAHLPAAAVSAAQLLRLNAWLAAQRRDAHQERVELERLLVADPADVTATDRLAELAERAGQPDEAARLSVKRAELDALRARYETLHARAQPIRNAVELARLAEQLGRVFEARAFLTVAVRHEPQRGDLRRELERLNRNQSAVAHDGQTLSGLLAPQLDDEARTEVKPQR
jgi:tetratricopeptide (TPR) repeat protein